MKRKLEQNYVELRESCIQLNKRNKELESNNRILLEKSERDANNLIKESRENDENVELINDLSQAASEIHEENLR